MLWTANELAYMRETADLTMQDMCNVVRDIQTSDGGGGFTVSTSTVATVACGLKPLSTASEQAIASRLGWSSGYAIRVPVGTDVTPADRITIGMRTFEVGAVVVTGTQATATTAICREAG